MTSIRSIIRLIRYRFLLFAGLLPYCLGSAIAYSSTGRTDFILFAVGLTGLFFVLVGVETFNEYFDWRYGTDRVFQLDPKPVGTSTLYIGIASFCVAFVFAVFLTAKVGWGILFFASLGFIAAAGYLGPPVRFTYRGLGEIVIALSYGPAMVLGSYYLQTGRISLEALFVSAIPAILLFNIAIINEVPDFLQDRLVGKRNLCVRMGREAVVKLYGVLTISFFLVCAVGLVMGKFPRAAWLVIFLAPLAYRNYRTARSRHDDPFSFLPAIRGTIVLYVATIVVLILGFQLQQ